MIDRTLSRICRSVIPWKAGLCTLVTFTTVTVIYNRYFPLKTLAVSHCEGFPIHFLEINIQNICVVFWKALILYDGFPLKRVNMRIQSEYRKIRTSKNSVFGHFLRSFTFYTHENWTFSLTRNWRLNIQKKLMFKTNSNIKHMVGNIDKGKMKMLTERDFLLLIIL